MRTKKVKTIHTLNSLDCDQFSFELDVNEHLAEDNVAQKSANRFFKTW